MCRVHSIITAVVRPGLCRAHAVECIDSCAGFLGDVHATSAEPLHPRDIFRKHPLHGVLYHNWNLGALKDGDVLVVRNNHSFFAAMTAGRMPYDVGHRQQRPPTPSDTPSGVEAGAPEPTRQAPTFRSQAMQFFREPNSSWCASYSC